MTDQTTRSARAPRQDGTTRVRVVGALFVAQGVWGLGKTLWGLALADQLLLDFGLLQLCFGAGLLHLQESSRRWAICWIILHYMLFAILLLAGFFPPEALVLPLYCWMHHVLRSPETVRLFNEERDRSHARELVEVHAAPTVHLAQLIASQLRAAGVPTHVRGDENALRIGRGACVILVPRAAETRALELLATR